MDVQSTAPASAIGSARKTAKTFSGCVNNEAISVGIKLSAKDGPIIFGSIIISGINKIIFLNIARKTDIFAWPKAINVC